MKNFKKLFYILSHKERRGVFLLLIMTIITALLDTIGVASILPFIAVLTNPSLIETNLFLNYLFQTLSVFGVETNQQFFLALGVIVFSLLILSLIFKAFTTYVQFHFIQFREYSISKRLVEGYLHQPYSWFLNQNSADLGKNILSEVTQIIAGSIRPLIELTAKGIVTISLLVLLFVVNPKLSIIIGLSFAAIYLFIFYFVRNYLKFIGKERLKNNRIRFTTISEAFGAIKEVKLGDIEKTYIKKFSNSAIIYARTQAYSQVLSQLPRYIIEAIAFGGILLIVLFLMVQTGSFNNSLPIISLYVFAGYRLMPALQQIYASFTQLTFTGPLFDKLHEDLKNLKSTNKNQDKGSFTLNKSINLKNIYYNYPNSSKPSLKDVSLNIPSKSTIGLVGATGSGKTTTVDIILGLLEPEKGTLEVDENVITKNNLRSWQRLIGYVPQNIYLSDDTVEANIAFGVDHQYIDQDRVKKVSKIANIHNFVINELPNQYQTKIGERGIRLSGGQCQRIGIARALYHKPKVLVMDEATSALDNQTEEVIMEQINNLSKKFTIIIIAHRLNTLKKCDIIFKFKEGKVVGQSTFNELTEKIDNKLFYYNTTF